jgi:hypothetical protein
LNHASSPSTGSVLIIYGQGIFPKDPWLLGAHSHVFRLSIHPGTHAHHRLHVRPASTTSIEHAPTVSVARVPLQSIISTSACSPPTSICPAVHGAVRMTILESCLFPSHWLCNNRLCAGYFSKGPLVIWRSCARLFVHSWVGFFCVPIKGQHGGKKVLLRLPF